MEECDRERHFSFHYYEIIFSSFKTYIILFKISARFSNVFEKSVHLLYKKYSKISYIVKYCYNLIYMFSILIYF